LKYGQGNSGFSLKTPISKTSVLLPQTKVRIPLRKSILEIKAREISLQPERVEQLKKRFNKTMKSTLPQTKVRIPLRKSLLEIKAREIRL